MIRRKWKYLWGAILFLPWISASGKSLEICDVYLVHCVEEDFRRLSSYFCSYTAEMPHTILRVDPDNLAGIYFVALLNQRAQKLPQNSEIILRYLLRGDPSIHMLRLPLVDIKPRSKEIWLGLTASDQQERPIRDFQAWSIEFQADNEILGTRRSFLFPAGDAP